MIIAGNSHKQFVKLFDNQLESFRQSLLSGDKFIELGRQAITFSTTGAWIANGQEEAERMVGNALGWRKCRVGNWHSDRLACQCTRADRDANPLVEAGILPKPVAPHPADKPKSTFDEHQQIVRCVVCNVEYATEADRQIDKDYFHCRHCLEKSYTYGEAKDA